MSETIEFDFNDLAPVEVPVRFQGKLYVLREASEGAACQWKNACAQQARFDGAGKFAGVGNIADTDPLLLSLCLFEAGDDGRLRTLADGRTPDPRYLVPLATLRHWPARVVEPLVVRAKKISDLENVESQSDLEKRFGDTATALVALSESGKDRDAWREWMHATVAEKLGTTASVGPPEVAAKNGQAGGQDSSPLPAS